MQAIRDKLAKNGEVDPADLADLKNFMGATDADLRSKYASEFQADADAREAANLPRIAAHGHLHLAVKFSQEGRAQLRVVVKNLQRRSHSESCGVE